MGTDGAAGLLALRTRGWHTIAQNEATCVVYGMPRAAVERNAASEVLPLNRIGPTVAARLPRKTGCVTRPMRVFVYEYLTAAGLGRGPGRPTPPAVSGRAGHAGRGGRRLPPDTGR